MFRIVLSVAFVAVLAACQSRDRLPTRDSVTSSTAIAATQVDSNVKKKILFVGTSLTAGYGLESEGAFSYLIQRKIDSAGLPYETVNAGVSGETSAGLLQRLDWILKAKYDVLVIETGANDGLRGVAPEAIRANLREILRRAKAAHPEARILLIQMEALPNYGRSYGTSFHDLYTSVAREANVPLLPFLLDGVAGRADLNQGDGVHPNQKGEAIVAENVWRGLERYLK